MHLRAKWAERANTIIETGREPTFCELAKFISDRAKVANTLYGVDLNSNSQTNTQYNKKQYITKRTFQTNSFSNNRFSGKNEPKSHIEKDQNNGFKVNRPNYKSWRSCPLCSEEHALNSCK